MLQNYKAQNPQETFNEEVLCHWILYQVCDLMLAAKSNPTAMLSALKILEEELANDPYAEKLVIENVSPGVFSCGLWANGGYIKSVVNLSESNCLADALLRLAREIV